MRVKNTQSRSLFYIDVVHADGIIENEEREQFISTATILDVLIDGEVCIRLIFDKTRMMEED